ncbi:PHP domain-containing protein [Natronococcus occultus]|uniref:Putative metal-dependent phosphoesterase, PHP family n=1 Tax=Natronococcus occultus SP4 TaxID=694430 RepID=L0K6B1_9EURY|nr:PHP domain-containing protein [Natronococcus occultus]AGB39673.1 putative metal-dependent phosphoesterase, PHP family [Natronococcus occultus SP4]
MAYADLHVHTTRSDGALELEEIPAAARRSDVAVVALTDHDRLQPFDERAIERDGVTIVHGIELRVETDTGQRVDLLGYGIEPTSELEATTERIQRNRIERGRAIVERVEDRLGIDLGVTVEDGFGRPHVARAIDAHPDTSYDYEDAFEQLIGNAGPCFVPRELPSFERGRDVLAEAGRIVSLAHPFRYPDPATALELTSELDAVERYYPYGREIDPGPIDRAIERRGLFATGGTDAHERELGVAGLSEAAYRQLGLEDVPR